VAAQVAVALVVQAVAVDSLHVPVVAVAATQVVPVAAVALRAVPVAAQAVPVVDVQVQVVAVRRPVRSVVPVASRRVDVRASVPSVKSSTTCRHLHPRVKFVRWVRARLFACPVAPA